MTAGISILLYDEGLLPEALHQIGRGIDPRRESRPQFGRRNVHHRSILHQRYLINAIVRTGTVGSRSCSRSLHRRPYAFRHQIRPGHTHIIALTRIDRHSVIRKDSPVVLPPADICQIVSPEHKSELVVRLPLCNGIKRSYGILRRRHSQLYVIHHDFQFRMSRYSRDRSLISFASRVGAHRIFYRVLRRNHKIHHIESHILGQVAHYRQMPDVKRVE